MTSPIASIDNTTLLNLTPNLDIGDVADPALRLAYFQYLNVYIQTITTAYNAFVANGAVGTVNLADLSVTTGKLALLAVTAAQIANQTITATQIANETITSTQILNGTIVNADINASAAIDGSKLANESVTSQQIQNDTIVNVDINSAAAIAWSKISKTGSSLTDLATRLITDLTGILSAAQFPALTGDLTTVAGALVTTLKDTGTAGTYKSVTTDAKGRVTGGTNPNTLLGFGITDAAPLSHVGTGDSAHALATTSQSGFISAADLIAFRSLTPTGLGTYAVPVGQIFSLWSRYSQEQDPVTGEMVFYEI